MLLRALFAAPLLALGAMAAPLTEVAGDLAGDFACEVDRRLEVPEEERQAYGERLREALRAEGLVELAPQHFLLVDRARNVQAAFIYRLTPGGDMRFTGAVPAATGVAGGFEHFLTPLGVFAHTPDNPDFRAEGTRNENGILGYGVRGMRVFDFGWIAAPKGWGDRAPGLLRLQVHATDPDLLEPLLGRARSKGCIRIPASLDAFLDRRGLLDAAYEAAAAQAKAPWVLGAWREATRWPGRYLVVIDTERRSRPAWSPDPGRGRPRSPREPGCPLPAP